jgi:beta-N-acetylhexosaminidase
LSLPDAPRAVVFGCSGKVLTDEERDFFAAADPLGFILFARNVETPDQVRALVSALRAAVGRADAPVLIDQEGGRVQRLRPPHWTSLPPMRRFGELVTRDPGGAMEATRLAAGLIAAELDDLGIDVDCAPVLDLPAPDGHEIIGDRAFSDDPAVVAQLGRAVCEGLAGGGVMPVIKHIPGHGRATADSHLELPRVATALGTLRETDFRPFRSLADAASAMTAHIVYSAIDPARPCSASPTVIGDIVRGEIGFDGLLFSDDVCMKALAGPLGERVDAVLAAGCDVALHCDGNLGDMREIARTCPPMRADSLARLARGRAPKPDSQAFDAEHAKARISGLLGVI